MTVGFPFDSPGDVLEGCQGHPRSSLHLNGHLQACTDIDRGDLDRIEAIDDEGERELNSDVRTGVVHSCLDDRPLVRTLDGDFQCRVERCFTVDVLRKGYRLEGVRVSHPSCRYLDEVGGPVGELLVVFVQASRAGGPGIDHRVVLVDRDVAIDVRATSEYVDVNHLAGAVDASGDQWFEIRTVDLDVDHVGERGATGLSSICLFGSGHTAIS